MFRFLPLVLKNCWRNRRRTFLTIASISISMCLLGVMIAMYHALYLSDATPEQALRLVTRNKISLTQQMPESYRNRIKQIPGVREVMVSQWFGGTYKDPKNFFARFAADADKIFTIFQDLKIPDDQRIAFERDRTGCVIGRDLANKYNLKIGDRMALVGDIFPGDYEFTVRGIFDSPRASEIMYFNREYLEQTLPERRRGQAGVFTTLIDQPSSAGRIAAAIDDEYRNASDADQDGERTAVPARLCVPAGQRQDVPDRDLRRGHVHHSAGLRQHHGDERARARPRGGRTQDPGIHRRQHPRHDPGRGDCDFPARRHPRLPAFHRARWRSQPQSRRTVSPADRAVPTFGGRIVYPDRLRHRFRQFPGAGAGRRAHSDCGGAAQYGLTAMAIPLAYNLRNLVVRKTTTIMTALGIALTVAVLLAVLALVNGLRTTLASSGDPLQIVVMRKGSESEIVSNFTRTQFQDLKFKPGIATGANGQPLASLEVVTVINLSSTDTGDGTNMTVRGLQPAGIEMRRGVKLASGRWFQEGKRELVVGKTVAERYPEAQIGQQDPLRPRRLGNRRRDGRRTRARRPARSGAT